MGQGAVSRVSLSIDEVLPSSRESLGTFPTRRLRVFIVDDYAPLRASLAALLRTYGHEVMEAGSYEEAMTKAATEIQGVDVVLADVVMRLRSGAELVRDLCALRPDLPCILTSGDARHNSLALVPKHVRFLAKPFRVEEVQQLFEEVVT